MLTSSPLERKTTIFKYVCPLVENKHHLSYFLKMLILSAVICQETQSLEFPQLKSCSLFKK